MNCLKELIELDSVIDRIEQESDPFPPVLPSPEKPEELLEDGMRTLPTTPLRSPHPFL